MQNRSLRSQHRAALGLILAVLSLSACNAAAPTTAPSFLPSASVMPSPAPTAKPATTAPAQSPDQTTTPAGDRPDLAAVTVTAEPLVGGLDQPLWVTGAGDGSGRLFVGEQPGRIRIVRDGQLAGTPFLDITDRVGAGGERGLLGFAFPPGFGPSRPVVFVHYSDRNGDTTVSEFRLSADDPDVLDPASERVLLTVPQPFANHNGGWIGFDADGMLLVALGDGGSGGDPGNRASDLGQLLGKMLRIDVLDPPDGQPYGIPDDNPYARATGARPEILHSGLRNPFRSSVDPATGDLWIGDVGQGDWEEIDVAPAGSRGLDFGWRRWEGRHCFDPATGCDPAGVTQPVTEYGHGAGCSVIGGVVYRGEAIPALRGGYLFGDYCAGTLWAIDAGMQSAQAPVTLAETGRSISAIGTGDDGEVYIADLGSGQVLRLAAGG